MKRVSLVLNVINSNNLIIDYYLNHEISAFIYSLIDDSEFHDSRNTNKFCFSNVIFKNNKFSSQGIHITESKAHLLISSDNQNIIDIISKNINFNQIYNISNIIFKIVQINDDSYININKSLKVKTISPIVIMNYDDTGYLSLLDNTELFISGLKKNIITKIGIVSEIDIFVDMSSVKQKRVRFKNGFVMGFLFNFEIKSDNDVILKSYYNGFGSKNAMGFGFVKQIK